MITKTPSQVKLYAPKEYWIADATQLSQITNGCGTGGWKGKLVPEKLWGVNVGIACKAVRRNNQRALRRMLNKSP